jgi:uncharacterized protein YjiK
MKKITIISWSVLSLLVFSVPACTDAVTKNKTPEAYNLNEPEKFVMPDNLLEISGICFYNGESDTVYAVQDEDGKVFRIAPGTKKSYPTKFSKKGDYEDIALINDRVFVLKSDGSIFSFSKTETNKEEADSVRTWDALLPKGEYEGMCAASDKLYVICKSCETDDNYKQVSGFILDTGDSVKVSSAFSIDVRAIQSFTPKLKSGFKPAALAKNPLTGEWFILSGSNKLLVITDAAWKVKDVYRLNGNTFNQAEGIAFDREGNLYISNEGDDEVNGNILLFKRN